VPCRRDSDRVEGGTSERERLGTGPDGQHIRDAANEDRAHPGVGLDGDHLAGHPLAKETGDSAERQRPRGNGRIGHRPDDTGRRPSVAVEPKTEALRRIQNVVADRELRVDLGRCRLCGAPATVELFAGHCLCRQCCDRLAA
jgi:hypothetical protein